jgi:hypothetical protein
MAMAISSAKGFVRDAPKGVPRQLGSKQRLAGVDDVEPGGEAFGLAAAGQHRKLVIDAEFH